MEDKDTRAYVLPPECVKGVETGPKTIIVRQVIGEVEKQKVLDINVVVPPQKPSIEQIVDVFVKDVEVTSIDVITDKVIVRGEFEIKAIYVACLPDQPVHAVEIKHYRWTQDIAIPGARKGMDADASVTVEYVDYDVEENCRAYKHKHHELCNTDYEDECEPCPPCPECPVGPIEDECTREFTVSVVLKIVAKVLADREITIGGALPPTPKG